MTGGPTLPTIDCWVQRLAPGFSGREKRRSSSSVTYVISGTGRIETDGDVLSLSPGDVVALPNWTSNRLVNDSRTDPVLLFSMHDTPALTALGLFYEEPEDILNSTPTPTVPTVPLTPIYRDGAFYDADER